MEQKKKKSKTPLATEVDYLRVIELVTLEKIKILDEEMGAKKFSFSAAFTMTKKADCISDFELKKQQSKISRNRKVSPATISRWFREYKNSKS